MTKTYKTSIAENNFDPLEKRQYLRGIYDRLDFNPLLNCEENLTLAEFKNMCLLICNVELGVTTYRVLKSFLLDCAKENFPDSKILIRKMNIFAERFGF